MIQKIHRDEVDELHTLKGWLLIYGRRKVGKTFLLKNYFHYDHYFMVRRDGKIVAEKFPVPNFSTVEQFLSVVREALQSGKTIVIDEFQRLPAYFYDEIARVHPQGRLLLSGSSMRIIKKIMSENSPLLGLLLQYKLGTISPANIFQELAQHFPAEKALEYGAYVRDPWLIPFIDEDHFLESLFQAVIYSDFTIPALVGEIFTEEERELSKVYEAILRLLGAGEWNYQNIASTLANRGIIPKADSSLVLPYFKNMMAMGLIEMLPLFSSPKKRYHLSSAAMELFYYLDDRYMIRERKTSFAECRPTLEKLRNLAVEQLVGDLLAQLQGGRKEYVHSAEQEIDFLITVRNKPVIVGEVKWGAYDQQDLKKFKEKSAAFTNAQKILVVKKVQITDPSIQILTADHLLKEVQKWYQQRKV